MVLYAINAVFFKDVFAWNPAQIGLILFVIGFVDIFSQGFLINKLLPKFGEIKVSILGLILTAVGFSYGSFNFFNTLRRFNLFGVDRFKYWRWFI